MLAVPLIIIEIRFSLYGSVFGRIIIVKKLTFKLHLTLEIVSSPPKIGIRELREHGQAFLQLCITFDFLFDIFFVTVPAIKIQLAFFCILTQFISSSQLFTSALVRKDLGPFAEETSIAI